MVQKKIEKNFNQQVLILFDVFFLFYVIFYQILCFLGLTILDYFNVFIILFSFSKFMCLIKEFQQYTLIFVKKIVPLFYFFLKHYLINKYI